MKVAFQWVAYIIENWTYLKSPTSNTQGPLLVLSPAARSLELRPPAPNRLQSSFWSCKCPPLGEVLKEWWEEKRLDLTRQMFQRFFVFLYGRLKSGIGKGKVNTQIPRWPRANWINPNSRWIIGVVHMYTFIYVNTYANTQTLHIMGVIITIYILLLLLLVLLLLFIIIVIIVINYYYYY